MKTLKKIINVMKKYWKHQLFASICTILQTLSYLLLPYMYKLFIDEVLTFKREDLFLKVMLGYFGVVLSIVLFDFLKAIPLNIMNQKVIRDLRVNLYKVLRIAEIKDIDRFKTGTLMSYILNDTQQMTGDLIFSPTVLLENILRITIGTVVLAVINPKILLIIIILLPFYSFYGFLFKKPIRNSTTKVQEQNAKISDAIQENLSGTYEIVVLDRKEWELKRLIKLFEKNVRKAVKNSMLIKASGDVGFIVYWIAIVLTNFLAGRQVLNGFMSVGMLLFYVHYIDNIFMPSRLIIDNIMGVQKSIASGERYFKLIEELSPKSNEENVKYECKNTFDTSIRFEGVTFKYNESTVLDNISFEINKGETVGIVGPSGSGKSTIIKLLLNLYSPTNGQILIDSTNVSNIKREDLYNIIGVVFQDVFLFDDTIQENVRLGNLDATDEEVSEACHIAGASDFIQLMEKGYGSLVGERGSKLSGGQKQRLAIARTLLRDSDIIVLDEATSALDLSNKKIIKDAIETLKDKGKTIIFITHDLASIENLDKVIVLSEGKTEKICQYNEVV